MPRQNVKMLLSCRPWRVFWHMGLVWLLAAAAAVIVVSCEKAAFGAVLHGRLVVNAVVFLVLAGLVDGTIALFQAGWFRFNESGYGVHIPWKGRRSGGRWMDVNFIALVPGYAAGTTYSVMMLIVDGRGKAQAMEYRKGLERKLLELCPELRVAALAENRQVKNLCQQLDEDHIGWLPLAWVRHMDGSGELVLRSQTYQPGENTAYEGEEKHHA